MNLLLALETEENKGVMKGITEGTIETLILGTT